MPVTCPAEAALLGCAHACPRTVGGPNTIQGSRGDKLLLLATALERMTEDWVCVDYTSELPRLCGTWSTAVNVEQWRLGGWAPLPRQLFQHSVTPAMYTLGTCLTRRGAC